jgi:hypothetical protein
MAEPILRDRSGSDALDERDRELLASVPDSLAAGLALKQWWERTDAARSYAERFPLIRTFNEADSSFGFFDRGALPGGRSLPVMGLFQEMFYDRPKSAEALFVRDQLREFVLRYFMRVSDFRLPQAYVPADTAEGRFAPPGLSWCSNREEELGGFGYSQLYYKLAGSGRIGKFPAAERSAIVDLREIGPTYEWIVVKVRIFDFTIDFRPLGNSYPYLALPLREETLLVLSREFIRYVDDPEPGLLGKYGFGYALVRNPAAGGVLAYGPGRFDAGFQLIDFKVLDGGESRVCLTFVVNRPERILDVPIDPVGWSFQVANVMSLGFASRLLAPFRESLERRPMLEPGVDPVFAWIAMANALTGGRAGRELCISREQLEKFMLVQHFLEHYTMISGSLVTWRRVRDWCDPGSLPKWVATGETL